MLQFKPGTIVPKAEQLDTAYCISQGEIKANIHSPYILDLCLKFLNLNRDRRIYFYLEVPEGLKRELDISSDASPQNPMEAFRVEFESFEKASSLLFFFTDLLARDGLCRFKFGTDNGDEISVGKYSIVTLTSEDTDKYEKLFSDVDVPKTEKLVTAYDTFSKEAPGISKSYTYKGIGVMDIPKYLKMYGIIA